MLTPGPLEHLQVILGELDAGGSTGEEPYTHGDSEELFVVLEGVVSLQLGARDVRALDRRLDRLPLLDTASARQHRRRSGGGDVDHQSTQLLTASRSEAAAPDVQLVGVTKRFGSMAAVDAIDLEVRPGEFLSLLGPSGCGKTTTLRLIAGFERPDEGEVRIGRTRRVAHSAVPKRT